MIDTGDGGRQKVYNAGNVEKLTPLLSTKCFGGYILKSSSENVPNIENAVQVVHILLCSHSRLIVCETYGLLHILSYIFENGAMLEFLPSTSLLLQDRGIVTPKVLLGSAAPAEEVVVMIVGGEVTVPSLSLIFSLP
jgi:hypothetical protein